MVFLISYLNLGFGLRAQNKSYPFKEGEKLIYSVHFGWFEIGEAELWIDPELQNMNGEAHYLIRCNVKSSPWFKMFKAMDMCFESMVKVEDLSPTYSFRDIRQGKKIDVRHDRFSYADSVGVEAYH